MEGLHAVYLEQWVGLQRPRIGWWRQCTLAYFEVPGPRVSEIQTWILEDADIASEAVDKVHLRWQVRPHPKTDGVSEALARQTGGAP